MFQVPQADGTGEGVSDTRPIKIEDALDPISKKDWEAFLRVLYPM
jgi:hypothetical protein